MDDSLTIRLDSTTKTEMKRAADAAGLSLTDFLVRAAQAKIYPLCPTCGRSDVPGTLPPGLTDAFVHWFDEKTKGRKELSPPVVVTTHEQGVPKVYFVNMRSDTPLEGTVSVYAILGQHWPQIPLQIPRGVITGWREESVDMDLLGHWYKRALALGYVDGNEPARQIAILQRQYEQGRRGHRGGR